MTDSADVLVIGGGAIGCALARELAGRGRRVVLLERGEPGQEASGAAAGLLSPQSDCRTPGPLFDLARESMSLYPQWVRDLEEESGREVGFRVTGLLRCAVGEREAAALDDYAWQAERGLALEWWSSADLASGLQGRLAPAVSRALFFPDEAVVDSRRLTLALWTASERLGARMLPGRAADTLWIEGGRCLGVQTGSGRIAAEAVVDAAGAWARFDPALPLPLPVEPVRGQILELEPEGDPIPTVVHSESAYLVPRPEGRLLVGATVEEAGFVKAVTAEGLFRLLEAALLLMPSLSRARFVGAWAGLRPGTPDALPILGGCDVPGLFFATGHYRSGILLAPVTARLVADELTGGPVRDLSPFSVRRFAPGAASGKWGATAEVFG